MAAQVSLVNWLRTCDEDGTHHWSHIKRIADSGVQYLHAVNTPHEPTAAMLLGTLVHQLVLGTRAGAKRLVRYDAEARRGNAWKAFAAEHADAEIMTAREWAEGQAIAAAVLRDPVARAHLRDARYEVPLEWDESGLRCATSGIDIVLPGRIGDLKTTTTTELRALQRQCFSFGYHGQLAFYRRGCIANGIDVAGGMFLLCVETNAPYEVVVLEMSEDLIELGDQTVALLLEKLRAFKSANEWPGRAQVPVMWTVPEWMTADSEEE